MSRDQVTIHTLIAAPPETVWACWTGPDHITQWNFASDDWCCPGVENDLSVGGWYKARMEARDGSTGFDLEAVYSDVILNKRLSYTMVNGRKVTTLFESRDGSTKVTTTFDSENEHSIDMQRSGWQSILNNFKKYVESRPAGESP